MNETLTLHIGSENGRPSFRYQVTPTGKVTGIAVGSDPFSDVGNDLVLIGFTSTPTGLAPITVAAIDYTLDNLFDDAHLVIGSHPIFRSFEAAYSVNMKVHAVEHDYTPKHRKEGINA